MLVGQAEDRVLDLGSDGEGHGSTLARTFDDRKGLSVAERERHDYRAMTAEARSWPGQERVVWARPVTKKTRAQATAIASTLDYWLRHPHRTPAGRNACVIEGCTPHHLDSGSARSHTEGGTVRVLATWNGPLETHPEDLSDTITVTIDRKGMDPNVVERLVTDALRGEFGNNGFVATVALH